MCSTSSIDPVRWFAGRAAARWMLADRALKAVVGPRELKKATPVDFGHVGQASHPEVRTTGR